MLLKRTFTFIAIIAFCSTVVKANESFSFKDTIAVKHKTRKIHLRPIDTLTLVHEGQNIARENFANLLASQLSSPLKILLETGSNEYIQDYIHRYTKENYRPHLAKMMGLSAYYFPLFENIFKETGIPSELKYLAIIESSLNPHAVSRVGATGPWQFMYTTAKAYGLTMNSYVDERKDPISASYAASAYLKEAYAIYNDWFLAIASYNCGRGNVNRAIERCGKSEPTFWDIRAYLPQETRNYVPAFIAMYRILENHKKYNIKPQYTALTLKTELIMVNRKVSLKAIANALNTNLIELKVLNPSYKRNIVNGSKQNRKRLIVPAVEKASYAKLYHILEGDDNVHTMYVMNASVKAKGDLSIHRVRKGEALEEIAQYYNVTVQDLKVWNRLPNSTIVPGQKLRVNNAIQKPLPAKTQQYSTYKVRKGDTLIGISKRFKGTSVSSLKAMNELKNNLLKPGMTLRINRL